MIEQATGRTVLYVYFKHIQYIFICIWTAPGMAVPNVCPKLTKPFVGSLHEHYIIISSLKSLNQYISTGPFWICINSLPSTRDRFPISRQQQQGLSFLYPSSQRPLCTDEFRMFCVSCLFPGHAERDLFKVTFHEVNWSHAYNRGLGVKNILLPSSLANRWHTVTIWTSQALLMGYQQFWFLSPALW